MSNHICATCGLPVKQRFFKRGRLRKGGVWQHVGVPGKKACGREPTPKLVKNKLGPALTWDALATMYDSATAGRRARTLPMDTVFAWAASQRNLSVVRDGTIHRKETA